MVEAHVIAFWLDRIAFIVGLHVVAMAGGGATNTSSSCCGVAVLVTLLAISTSIYLVPLLCAADEDESTELTAQPSLGARRKSEIVEEEVRRVKEQCDAEKKLLKAVYNEDRRKWELERSKLMEMCNKLRWT